ncbi:hypothetical protein [Chitinimonas naiadis]
MSFAKIGLFFGAIAMVLLLQHGHFNLALLLLGFGMAWGAWRIWRVIAESREREARQWRSDETLQLPRRDKPAGK